MDLIAWDNNYSVNVEELDEQHQKIISMINELVDSMAQGTINRNKIYNILQDLADFTVNHFEIEEDYFKTFDYPESFSHKQEHQDFIDSVADFKKRIDEGKIVLPTEIFCFLRDWFVNHLLTVDKGYCKCSQDKGVK